MRLKLNWFSWRELSKKCITTSWKNPSRLRASLKRQAHPPTLLIRGFISSWLFQDFWFQDRKLTDFPKMRHYRKISSFLFSINAWAITIMKPTKSCPRNLRWSMSAIFSAGSKGEKNLRKFAQSITATSFPKRMAMPIINYTKKAWST